MTPKDLREWLFKNNKDDQWWLSINGVTEESPLSSWEIEELLQIGDYGTKQALHVSQTEVTNPFWIDVEPPAQAGPLSPNISRVPNQRLPGKEDKPQNVGKTVIVFIVCVFLFLGTWYANSTYDGITGNSTSSRYDKIERTVLESMNSKFANDEDFKDYYVKVISVTLAKSSGNSYDGIAKVRVGQKVHDLGVDVTSDNGQVVWSAPSAYSLILEQMLEELAE